MVLGQWSCLKKKMLSNHKEASEKNAKRLPAGILAVKYCFLLLVDSILFHVMDFLDAIKHA